jgi:hypothetical protein
VIVTFLEGGREKEKSDESFKHEFLVLYEHSKILALMSAGVLSFFSV